MSYKVTVEGTESFEIAKECVRRVKFTTDIRLLTITGRILTAVDGDPFDSTRKLALWSAVPAEKADCYRKVTIEHVAAGVMERKYYFPNAFVIDYKEDFGDVEGTGIFTLVIKQKKDKLDRITVEGGYAAV